MPLYRAQVAACYDSILPRDRIVNTLHFDDEGVTSDPTGLANDLADVFLNGWYPNPKPELRVSFYEVGVPPNDPVAEVIRNVGVAPLSTQPREVALCLSFYSQQNRPSKRGRIYLANQGAGTLLEARPSLDQRNKALALASAFSDLGGTDVDWVVYSPTTSQHHDISHAWVDDEWDTVRSRGLRATTRSSGMVTG